MRSLFVLFVALFGTVAYAAKDDGSAERAGTQVLFGKIQSVERRLQEALLTIEQLYQDLEKEKLLNQKMRESVDRRLYLLERDQVQVQEWKAAAQQLPVQGTTTAYAVQTSSTSALNVGGVASTGAVSIGSTSVIAAISSVTAAASSAERTTTDALFVEGATTTTSITTATTTATTATTTTTTTSLVADVLARGAPAVPADKALYDKAFDILFDQKYAIAALEFEQFLGVYPDSYLAPQAAYWLAESYYIQKKYVSALERFEWLLQRFPENEKAGESLLKKGYCLHQLKRIGEATTVFNQVKARYPNTTLAALAQNRLDTIH